MVLGGSWSNMFLKIITILLCADVLFADVAHLKTTKATILNRIHGKLHHHKHHHKRGIFSAVPPYKVGYDIPVVSHSFIKPLLVTYPTKPVPIGVKIPLHNPYEVKYPVGVGHKVPVPYPGYGLKFPGWPKPILLPGLPLKDDHHHHDHHIHHHHVAVKPVVPVAPAPVVPVLPAPQPVIPLSPPAPLPPPIHFHPAPSIPASTLVPLPPRPIHINPSHVHLKPAFTFALSPSPLVPIARPPPLFQIRPGNAVQTSVFATYPRYPLIHYHPQQLPIAPAQVPIGPPVPLAPAPLNPLLIGRPSIQEPHYHLFPQHQIPHFNPEHPTQVVPVQPTGSGTALHSGVVQPGVFVQQLPNNNGWLPVTSTTATFPTGSAQVPTQISPAHGYPAHNPHHYTEDNNAQVYDNTLQEQQIFEFQNQQHQLQEQFEQHQYEQHQLQQHDQQHQLENHQQQFEHQQQQQQQFEHQQQYEQHQQQHFNHQQVNEEYGVPQQQLNQEYGIPQQQLNQEYGVPEQQLSHEYGAPQQQLNQEYGLPQQRFDSNQEEGRTVENDNSNQEEPQRFHNHIPLGLQPPLQRPLEEFN